MSLQERLHHSSDGGIDAKYIILEKYATDDVYRRTYRAMNIATQQVVHYTQLLSIASHEEQKAFAKEAQLLEQITQAEQAGHVHYSLWLLDHNREGILDKFYVTESVDGYKLLFDRDTTPYDASHVPCAEEIGLDIAFHIAQALYLAHQLGICCPSLHENAVFWQHTSIANSIRIVGWQYSLQVEQQRDWFRLGALLYKLHTGNSIYIDQNDFSLSAIPDKKHWDQLSHALQLLIEDLLIFGLSDDAVLLLRIEKEYKLAQQSWQNLLHQLEHHTDQREQARIWSRAVHVIQQLPLNHPDYNDALEQLATIQQKLCADEQILAIRHLMSNQHFEVAQRLLDNVRATYPQDTPAVRRLAWIVQLAAEAPPLYIQVANQVEGLLDALEIDDIDTALFHARVAYNLLPHTTTLQWLLLEMEFLQAQAHDNYQQMGQALHRLRDAFDTTPDLARQYERVKYRQIIEQYRSQHSTRLHARIEQATKLFAQAQNSPVDEAVPLYEAVIVALKSIMSVNAQDIFPALHDAVDMYRAAVAYVAVQLEYRRGASLYQAGLQLAESDDFRLHVQGSDLMRETLSITEALQDIAQGEQLLAVNTLAQQTQQFLVTMNVMQEQINNLNALKDRDSVAELRQALSAIDELLVMGIHSISKPKDLLILKSDLQQRLMTQMNEAVKNAISEATEFLSAARDNLDIVYCDQAQAAIQPFITADIDIDHELHAKLVALQQDIHAVYQQLQVIYATQEKIKHLHQAEPPYEAYIQLAELASQHPAFPRLKHHAFDVELEILTYMLEQAHTLKNDSEKAASTPYNITQRRAILQKRFDELARMLYEIEASMQKNSC
ncbi:hypothetical protein HC928_03195 [bacterium]|nr:hypothetical protein [bacterium]